MEIGISFYYGYTDKAEERMRKIKQYGFDRIITNPDKKLNRQNGSLKKQIKLAKKYGLRFSSLHSSYKTEDLIYFWKEGKIGDKQEKTIIKELMIAKKYGFTCLVVHLSGNPSEIGIRRLNNILQYCKKVNLPIAIENIDCHEVFIYTLKQINSPYLKICYDSGHNNVFTPDYDILTMHSNQIITLHLSDNNGLEDQHTLPEYGTIDWEKVAQKIAKTKIEILDWEMLMFEKFGLTSEQTLEKCSTFAKWLKQRIQTIREENKKKQ